MNKKHDKNSCLLIAILIVILVLIFGVLGAVEKANAAVTIENGNLTFSGEDKNRVVLELEENNICKGILNDYRALTNDYKLNITDLYNLLDNHKKQMSQKDEIIAGYEEYVTEREEICQLEVKAAKTTFQTKFTIFGSGFGIGAILILLLVL